MKSKFFLVMVFIGIFSVLYINISLQAGISENKKVLPNIIEYSDPELNLNKQNLRRFFPYRPGTEINFKVQIFDYEKAYCFYTAVCENTKNKTLRYRKILGSYSNLQNKHPPKEGWKISFKIVEFCDLEKEIPRIFDQLPNFDKTNIFTFRVSITDNFTYFSPFSDLYWLVDYSDFNCKIPIVYEIITFNQEYKERSGYCREGYCPIYTFRPLFYFMNGTMVTMLNPICDEESLSLLFFYRKTGPNNQSIGPYSESAISAIYSRMVESDKYKISEDITYEKEKGMISFVQTVDGKKTMIWNLE
ncbi:MAG: hypothetical protein ABH830_02455 [Patescibacteria group bacterium]